jgi:hypothetical protein
LPLWSRKSTAVLLWIKNCTISRCPDSDDRPNAVGPLSARESTAAPFWTNNPQRGGVHPRKQTPRSTLCTVPPSALLHLQSFCSVHEVPDTLHEVSVLVHPPTHPRVPLTSAVKLMTAAQVIATRPVQGISLSLFPEHGYRTLEVLARTSLADTFLAQPPALVSTPLAQRAETTVPPGHQTPSPSTAANSTSPQSPTPVVPCVHIFVQPPPLVSASSSKRAAPVMRQNVLLACICSWFGKGGGGLSGGVGRIARGVRRSMGRCTGMLGGGGFFVVRLVVMV